MGDTVPIEPESVCKNGKNNPTFLMRARNLTIRWGINLNLFYFDNAVL